MNNIQSYKIIIIRYNFIVMLCLWIYPLGYVKWLFVWAVLNETCVLRVLVKSRSNNETSFLADYVLILLVLQQFLIFSVLLLGMRRYIIKMVEVFKWDVWKCTIFGHQCDRRQNINCLNEHFTYVGVNVCLS